MPVSMKECSIGVMLSERKDARKPSIESSIVVGAKRDVPLERNFVDAPPVVD